ncbi:HNH endonuclease [Streptomyces sp. MBT58]|uniref:HNH endonuclease n=1 Tax=Streptomyces sp. MBT58 TaxID=1488389 RepID=UPI0019149BDB|nr:HNH endonuclease signature motif containing protein [Streptomyces sp. MBT58]MBK5995868.1 HNH endonuclease [Streptomyces sp. MBT58]
MADGEPEPKKLPSWEDATRGSLVRGGLWLMQVVGAGNVFTKSQLRDAFPEVAQIDRRIRDLRSYGWVIDTSREDVGLGSHEQRFVKPGIPVWDPAARKRRSREPVSPSARRSALQRAHYACEMCGRAVPRLDLAHRVSLTAGGSNDLGNLAILCSACHAARDAAPGISDLTDRASSLPIREKMRLLTWMTMGERPRTVLEDIWAQYQQLSSIDKQEMARHLARLLDEDAQAEDGTP